MLYKLNIYNFFLSIIPQMEGGGRQQLDHLYFLIHHVLHSMKKIRGMVW